MARTLVEATSRENLTGNFPDVNPVVTLPAPPEGVVYRDPQIAEDLVFANAGVLNNLDTGGLPSDHTFNYFLRGTAVPGGELNLNPIVRANGLTAATIAEGESGVAGPQLPLVGDMRVEVEMGEAIDTVAPVFVQSWEDHYAPLNDLSVVPTVPGIQIGTFNDGAAFTLDGPSGFSTRMARFTSQQGAGLQIAGYIVNLDTVTHTISVTLRRASAPDVLLATKALLTGEVWSAATAIMALPAELALKEGDSLEIATATATTTTDPYVYAVYEDRV